MKDADIITPKEESYAKHVYHLYVIRVKKRDKLLKYLKSKGIFAGIHYPIPIHLLEACQDLGYKKGDFPITEKYAKEILSLPMFPELRRKQINYISGLINFYVSNSH